MFYTTELGKSPEEQCDMRRKMVEQVILEILNISEDPEKKEKFDSLFKEKE